MEIWTTKGREILPYMDIYTGEGIAEYKERLNDAFERKDYEHVNSLYDEFRRAILEMSQHWNVKRTENLIGLLTMHLDFAAANPDYEPIYDFGYLKGLRARKVKHLEALRNAGC